MDFIKQVAKIQRELKAPKSSYNNFGKYNYRSCEDILEGLKPLLGDLVLTINDDIIAVGDRIYLKAVATITDGKDSLSNTGLAREALTKKGMDDSQITGTASSYARKYALNGLFCIDDTKDEDATNTWGSNSARPLQVTDTDKQWIAAIKANPAAINQITDDRYKTYIQSLIK